MNVKRYLADSTAEAMAQIKAELGVEAFILNERKVRRKGLAGLFKKPMVEITAAYEPKNVARPSMQSERILPPDNPLPPERNRGQAQNTISPKMVDRAVGLLGKKGDLSDEEVHKAALSVLEKISKSQATSIIQRELYNPNPAENPPPPSPLISAYSPSAIAQKKAQAAAPAAQPVPAQAMPMPQQPQMIPAFSVPPQQQKPKDDGFRPFQPREMSVAEKPVMPPQFDNVSNLSSEASAFNYQSAQLRNAQTDQRGPVYTLSNKAGEGEGSEKMVVLENKIDTLSTTINSLVGKLQTSKERAGYPPEIEALYNALVENDSHEEFAQRIIKEVNDVVKKERLRSPDDEADPKEICEQILRQYLGDPAPIKLKKFKRTVVMLVGPTGVGKTTTLAKLAAIYQLNHHAKVGVITTDTYRIAAVEQLKTYAEILEIPLSVVYNPADITDTLKEHEDKDIVLIDTAGKSPNDTTHEEEVTNLIKYSDCDEIHLVLSATTSFTGLLNIINTYSFLRDYKLIFTKTDETPTLGLMLNTKFLTDKPISYVADGQNVPDNLEVFTPRKIVARLLGK